MSSTNYCSDSAGAAHREGKTGQRVLVLLESDLHAFKQMTQICQYPKPCDAATEALGAGNDTKALVRVTVLAVHGLCV